MIFKDIFLQSLTRGVGARMFYFLQKRTDACAKKTDCPCPLRKREKVAIGLAAAHAVLLAVNLYFFAEFAVANLGLSLPF